MKKNILTALGATLLVSGPTLLTSAPATAGTGGQPTIYDIVDTSPNFTTLKAALQATGLDTVLDGTDRFTVFAPTDAAFALLGQATIDALLNDLPTLTRILQYHVLAGDVDSLQVVASSYLTTLADQRLDVTLQGTDVRVDGVLVSTVDVTASNGIVHVIDAVLQPNLRTILETAEDVGGFSTLRAAVTAASLDGALDAAGPYTVFAPNDPAFALLPPAGLQSLVTSQIPLLTLLLQYHVVDGRLYSDELGLVSEVTTLLGAKLNVRNVGGELYVNGSRVIAADVEAVNGNIHVVEKVLGGERIF